MERKTHWFWDIAVLWPFIFVGLSLMISIFVALLNSSVIEDLLLIIIPLGILFYLGSMILMIVTYVYAVHQLYTGTNLTNDQKKMWLVLILLFNVITIPILHFVHLRKA